MLKIFCWLFFDVFQRTFISFEKLKRFRTELKCRKVLIEIVPSLISPTFNTNTTDLTGTFCYLLTLLSQTMIPLPLLLTSI